jgi:acyl carrier protein
LLNKKDPLGSCSFIKILIKISNHHLHKTKGNKMEKNEVKNKVIDIVEKILDMEDYGLSPSQSFDEMQADVLDIQEVLSLIEEEFEIEFENGTEESIFTIQDTIDCVLKKLNNKE